MFREIRKHARKAGQPPGTLLYTGKEKIAVPKITVTTYNEENFHEVTGDSLEECIPSDFGQHNLWINVDGLQDIKLIESVAAKYHLHPLTMEDILNVQQRAKIEEFSGYLFITLKILQYSKKTHAITSEQFSLVLTKGVLLTFQESESNLFHNVRERLRSGPTQRLRQQGCDYLMYRLVDTVVDNYYVVLEHLGDRLEAIEEEIIINPTPKISRNLYRLKRQILMLRKIIWPVREVVSHLMQVDSELITSFTQLYIRDVYDHAVQAIDAIETFRDMTSGLLDVYLSSITNRMNEIMKVLTIISTIFIPITFIASIYGMNFQYMPELHWRWGYPAVLILMVIITLFMLFYFRRKKWI